MNLEKTRRIAEVLILSAVRARRGETGKPKRVKNVLSLRNNQVAVIGFPVIAIIAYLFLFRSELSPILVSSFLTQSLIFIPFLGTFLMVMNGLLESTVSQYSTSTDIINWLPILPSEFVVGSTISNIYFSIPFLMIVYGATLGASIYVHQLLPWVVAFSVSILALFIGGFLVEVVRAFLNEASSAVSERGGRLSQILQLVTTLAAILILGLMFNYNVILRFMVLFGLTLQFVWFIPILWPSMIIQSLLTGDLLSSLLFMAGSMTFLVISFILGIYARKKYWVPKPITLKIGPSTRVKPVRAGSLGGGVVRVIALKDLRALLRRRDSMRIILVMPLMLFALNFLQIDASLLWNVEASIIERLTVFILPGMGLYMLSLMMCMVSVGQEGAGFINLQISPLTPRQIILGKTLAGFIPSGVILFIVLGVERYFIQSPLSVFFAIVVIGYVAVIEACFLGVMFGTMYPDFKEVPRARFISPIGSLIGTILSSIITLATLSPVFISVFIRSLNFLSSGVITILIGGFICFLAFKKAQSKFEELMLMN